jgi:hypothetical protein
MPTKIEITEKLLKPYLSGQMMHKGHHLSSSMYRELRVHADGEYPSKLIDERRPNESDRIKEYRQTIYEPITKDICQRVITSLTKIRRSVDWSVRHPSENYPSAVPEDERLYGYADKRLPLTENLENWIFTVALKNYLLDANAICLYVPKRTDISDGEYLEPFPIIYNSPEVIEWIPNELLIVRQTKETENLDGSDDETAQQAWLVVTSNTLQRWEKKTDGFDMTYEHIHDIGTLPAFKLGGQYFRSLGKSILYESRISPMLPRLNDAAREYSDMQAEVVQHIHSEKWVWASNKCPKCQNAAGIPTGFINSEKDSKRIICPNCRGNMLVPSSPYLNLVVRPTNENLGESAAPIPPAGYITKPVDIVRIQDERIDKHLYKALSSINMQFLDQTPLNISGKGKEIDRDELNNFVYSIAEDLVRIMDLSYRIIALYRYHLAIAGDKLSSILPEIKVPEKYDLLSSDYLTAEIKAVKDAGVNPIILNTLEAEFAAKKFYTDPKVRDMVVTILRLDPLPGRSEDDKMVMLSNGGISKLNYYISSNLTQIVRTLMEKDVKFLTLERERQFEQVVKRAQEEMTAMEALKVRIPDPIVPPVDPDI